MGWERRGNNYYYYRKRRYGRTVISEYLGNREFVYAILRLEARDKERLQSQRKKELQERDAIESEVERVDSLIYVGRNLLHSSLLASGYRTHKGQWRKRRVRRFK